MLNKTHKKISAKTFKEFKAFTGLSYYDSWYMKKPFRNKVWLGDNSRERTIWLPFWVDNYKRLNSLHNKLVEKTKLISDEISIVTAPLYKSLKENVNYLHLEEDVLYDITVINSSKTFSYFRKSVSQIVKFDSTFFMTPPGACLEDTSDKTKEIFTKYFALNKKREKYFKYLGLVEIVLTKVFEEIIDFKLRESTGREFAHKAIAVDIDNDKIICSIERRYMNGPICCKGFDKNIPAISL